jgi:riboflavin kinase/FMN adenylyltransferase
MKTVTSFEKLPLHAFTIGTFDGVHRGHQLLFKQLPKPAAVLTFPTHPLAYLRPPAPPPILSLERKLELFESFGIDTVFLIEFPKLAHLTYDQLLTQLPLSHLILGQGSIFGKNRGGTEANVRLWGMKHNIHVGYIELLEGVSSSRIREAIRSGNFNQAQQLLGHTYV